jgi:hypothetical protein
LRLSSQSFLWRVLQFPQIVLPQLLPIDLNIEISKLFVDLLIVESFLRQQIVFVWIFGLINGDEHFLFLLLIDFDGYFADLFLEFLATDDLFKFGLLQLFTLVEVEVEIAFGASFVGVIPVPMHFHVESLLDSLNISLFVCS